MSHFKALPNEERVKNMNKYQWLWCYYNIIEQEKQKYEFINDTIEYLSYFMNIDLAKAVKSEKEKKESKYKETNITNSNEVYNDTFEEEIAQYLKNEQFVELPSSNYKASTETRDEFFERAFAMEQYVNAYNENIDRQKDMNDDLDIIYTNE